MNHKLKSIIRHEYLTIVKQPAFLLTMLGVPLLMLAIGAILFFSERTAESSIEETAADLDEIAIVDESGLIEAELVASLGFELLDTDRSIVIEQVQDQELDGAIIYPEDLLEERRFDVYIDGGQDFIVSSAVSEIGEQILEASLLTRIEDERLAQILQQGAVGEVTAYQDGEAVGGVEEYIAPGAFLVIFFIILFFTMGYMLLGVAEEKENRSMEMVLSYVEPRILMSGKLLGIGLVALTQMIFFSLLGLIGYRGAMRFEGQFGIPAEIDFSTIVFDPVAIAGGVAILILGFLLFAALMSGVAAMMPGVKEANSLSSVFFLVPFVPFWSMPVIMAAPESVLVKFLSFFPVTSPTTLLLRNTIGNIGAAELALAVIVLAVFTVLAFLLAARLFRLGALEFADRVSLASILKG